MLSTVDGIEINGSFTLNMQGTEHSVQKSEVLSVLCCRNQISEQFWPRSFKLISYIHIDIYICIYTPTQIYTKIHDRWKGVLKMY